MEIECLQYTEDRVWQTLCGLSPEQAEEENTESKTIGEKMTPLYYNFTFFLSLLAEKNSKLNLVTLKHEV